MEVAQSGSRVKFGRAFAIGIGLNIAFVAVEIIYGLMANSSALLADAGHNASDVLGLAFAWIAAWLATLKPRGKYTYGLRKTTILVSILNALLLFGAMAAIGYDAIGKIREPQPVAGDKVMIVAAIGVLINSVTALLFIKGQKDDLNIRGAFLHMAADAAVSLGVVGAGLLIVLTGKQWIDPLMSFIIIGVILWGTWKLFTDSLDLALDAVPRNIDIRKVNAFLLEHDEVKEVTDLHVWAMSTTQVALTAHLTVPGSQRDGFLELLQRDLSRRFGIEHTTFQIVPENSNGVNDCGSKGDLEHLTDS
ncbi:MAG: cation diffusion facilitator family transporter [Bacteroidales bacterium]|nr:cation diffusion facilitator family transporter [Bacteroidales bacterium]